MISFHFLETTELYIYMSEVSLFPERDFAFAVLVVCPTAVDGLVRSYDLGSGKKNDITNPTEPP